MNTVVVYDRYFCHKYYVQNYAILTWFAAEFTGTLFKNVTQVVNFSSS